MNIEPIGVVRSCFGGKFAAPRQPGLCPSAWGSLVFYDRYASDEALRGIDGFSHLWLIFGFHQTLGQGWHPTVRPPRLGGNQRLGVFATRSPFRPNGLGLSLVRLEGIHREASAAPVLRLGGLDLIDGTPIFDVKPYLPYAESPPDASAGFASEAPPRLQVSVHEDAQEAFERLPERAQAVLREALALDPRPATQTGDAARIFGADLCGCNVRFTIAAGRCRIVEITCEAASQTQDGKI
ncbi:MAG: tRNA (N6-threonylcarbamoyladenosine(37)-N6)-methyltransferase TrmO [Verrucomicrobia bacterium]|nr:MAG: tRNA (N6-threonylcarbamoyladenosine(37)-N6)-methyltransferase TrmO [Verrucomicrobiota bacterium]